MDLTSLSLFALLVVARLLVVYLCLDEAGRLAREDLGLICILFWVVSGSYESWLDFKRVKGLDTYLWPMLWRLVLNFLIFF